MASTCSGGHRSARHFAWAATSVWLLAIGCGDNVSPAPRGGDSDAGCSANSLDSGFDEIQIGNGDVAAAMWTPYANTPSPNDDAANASVVDATTEEGTAPTTTNSNIEH